MPAGKFSFDSDLNQEKAMDSRIFREKRESIFCFQQNLLQAPSRLQSPHLRFLAH